jgi:hypothetical protein
VKTVAHLQSLLKSPVDESSAKFPSGAPTDSDVHPLSLPPHILLDAQKWSPPFQVSLTELPQREMLSFWIPQTVS